MKMNFDLLMKRLEAFFSAHTAPWVLFILFGSLFTWQQVTEYFAVKINFLPFSFYDYSLHYFFQSRIHFTGWLHGYYHHNLVLFLFAPLWKLFQSPWLLVLSYGWIASASVFPLMALARERSKDGLFAGAIAVAFLNYRYLQNVLQMNFSPEIFYPLFVFTVAYFAVKREWLFYYLFLFLLLSVKEDSFVYGVAVGVFTAFSSVQGGPRGFSWLHGLFTIFFSVSYYAFLRLGYSAWIGSDIMQGNAANYAGYGNSFSEIILKFFRSPWLIFAAFFCDELKVKVLFKVFTRVVFLPLFSWTLFPFFIALAPLFFHSTGRDNDFIELRFHYAAAVIPFVFIATIAGYSNFIRRVPDYLKNGLRYGVCFFLVILNLGSMRTENIEKEDLRSIAWAQSAPDGVLLTHGHLLPYVGYRKQNFYFAEVFGTPDHPARSGYVAPDFISIDMHVEHYPLSKDYFIRRVQELMQDKNYELIKQDRDVRFLFRRRTDREELLPEPGYRPLNELVQLSKSRSSL